MTRKLTEDEVLECCRLIGKGVEAGGHSIFAKCPAELESNEWYKKRGFVLDGTETTKSGRNLNLWRLAL